MTDSRQTDEALATLLMQWEEAWDQGQDIPVETLCLKCPEFLEQVRVRITALKQMAWMTKPDSEPEKNVNAPDLLLGRTLAGRYRIETLIAEGGFGRVYRAFDPELQRHVALKVPKPSRVSLPEQADQLLNEARRAAKLRHPGIVSIYDVGRDDGLVFIVADLIEGENLAELIDRQRPAPREAARIIADVADALHFAHDQGFVHRDIKPANIMIDEHGRPHITDFGIAATVEQILKGENATSGTLAYMAPEQLGGETHLIGSRTDIHALGVVLYELLTGKFPFASETPHGLREDIQFRQPQPMAMVDGSIPDDLQRICFRCLSKHPSDRFNSMTELAMALRKAKTVRTTPGRAWWLIVPMIVLLLGTTIWMGKDWTSRPTSIAESAGESVKVLEPEEGTFVFDGKSRIVTPVVSFAPCTLEAWVRTTGEKQEQFIIGSDVPNFYGIGIGIKNNAPIVETIRGGFDIERHITPGQWTHLAAVYGPDETVLFLNGKKVGVGPATQPPSRPTHFVIGNVGEDHNRLFFHGQIRCLRISRDERYSADFVPDSSFAQDTADARHRAVLIFDSSKIEGEREIDLSGEGNDGVLARP